MNFRVCISGLLMMATPTDVSFLKAQLLAVQRLLPLVANHPLMSNALTRRESELREKIEQADACIVSVSGTPKSGGTSMNPTPQTYDREYHFALIVGGVSELTSAVEDALFQAGCDDATVSMQHGRLYIEFSRSAGSLDDAIIGAIHDVRKADIGAEVLRVDECNLVTASEIARRMGRTRQLVHQYMNGTRGPGGFPPPECHLTDHAPLWAWCAVSYWLVENNLLRPEESWNAEVVEAINNWLESERQRRRYPKLIDTITRGLQHQ